MTVHLPHHYHLPLQTMDHPIMEILIQEMIQVTLQVTQVFQVLEAETSPRKGLKSTKQSQKLLNSTSITLHSSTSCARQPKIIVWVTCQNWEQILLITESSLQNGLTLSRMSSTLITEQ